MLKNEKCLTSNGDGPAIIWIFVQAFAFCFGTVVISSPRITNDTSFGWLAGIRNYSISVDLVLRTSTQSQSICTPTFFSGRGVFHESAFKISPESCIYSPTSNLVILSLDFIQTTSKRQPTIKKYYKMQKHSKVSLFIWKVSAIVCC